MFGLGIMEIFVILIVAVIALGPEKLPTVAVDVARFLKKLKGGIDDAKSALDNELNLSGLKEEAEKLKGHMNFDRLANLDLDNINKNEVKPETKVEIQPEVKPDTKIEIKKEEIKA
ncbi:MAG: twin-arginine translocase subunit TatB [Arcobacter sp.]|nr:twin-arginine translocase subunit TatB [Arcobacter sp.]